MKDSVWVLSVFSVFHWLPAAVNKIAAVKAAENSGLFAAEPVDNSPV